jgi:signal transduction histidine kinase
MQSYWVNPEWQFIIGLQEISVYFLLMLPLIVLLGFVTGRRPEDDELHQGYLERIYSDILLAILGAVIILGAIAWIATVGFFADSGIAFESVAPGIWFGGLIGCLTGTLSLILGNALIRKVKAHNLLRHSLIYKLTVMLLSLLKRICDWFYQLWLLVFSGFDKAEQPLASRLFKRQRRFLLLGFVLGILICFFALLGAFIISLFFIFCLLALVYYFLFSNKADFIQLQEGLDASLSERLKSEQMKVDLITNVSHDLKTPLTSIISYADLLSKEKRLSPAAKDYVQILQQKSDRLNHIVSDLFDLAKSTSGNIMLEIETLDLKRLFEQTLADLEDHIAESGMEVRSKLPEDPLMVRGDGKKLYRVLQNLLDNALKYSLNGSRIYIDLQEYQGKAQAVIKNTASYEMDFDAEEVLQRFNRGDKARSSEGSGLGLAIAQSFIHNCGGNFDVAVDGDQFKVIIEFPLASGLG